MLFPDGLKVMKRASALEIYDVLRDPQENNDLWEKLGAEGRRRLALLETYINAHAKSEPPDEDE
jgi:hypothetical protein